MRIIVDENIPMGGAAFGQFGTVRTMPGRAIGRDDLLEADALIVRSITRVDRALLSGTPVRFVGTATNGLDHIDLEYLREEGIGFADISGSNAESVAEYILAALLLLETRGAITFPGRRIGIIGVGNIGSKVSAFALALGLDVVEYDPPRALRDSGFVSAERSELLSCSILTVHVPLVRTGEYPTVNMIDRDLLGALQEGSILMNTARGGAADSDALIEAMEKGRIAASILDVWKGEPDIPVELITRCTISTPHIAGYSADAKLMGTERMAVALASFFGLENSWRSSDHLAPIVAPITIDGECSPIDALKKGVLRSYDITEDHRNVQRLLVQSDAERREGFDLLRKNYGVRREFAAYTVESESNDLCEFMSRFGFRIR